MRQLTAGVDPVFWTGKRVLVTGDTGFKGAWLSLWLTNLGAEVMGFALEPPTSPSLFQETDLSRWICHTHGDVRNLAALTAALVDFEPEVVFHLAAQPLVRRAYRAPVETFEVNVLGTVNVLESMRLTECVKAAVMITTDKCYENQEWAWGYRESDPMGGRDPYSGSKGCAELAIAAYRRSFFAPVGDTFVASARAGNVIGGGDWAEDRLIPDILRALEAKRPVKIRSPHAIRPWQHVLEPLSGYLALAQSLYTHGAAYAKAWNFGPRDEDARDVLWIVKTMCTLWGQVADYRLDEGTHPHEATDLKLDSSMAHAELGWRSCWSLAQALGHTVDFARRRAAGEDSRSICLEQIQRYMQTQEEEQHESSMPDVRLRKYADTASPQICAYQKRNVFTRL